LSGNASHRETHFPFLKGEKMSEKNYIRFINSDYKTLFFLPDGGRIRITCSDGKQIDRVCRFIDVCHTTIGYEHFHICEFAERMEHIGAKYEPLDYIRDLEFYTKHFFAASDTGKGPTYYIIDETETHGFAFAPSGAEKGKKYCIYEQVKGAYGLHPGAVIQWSGTFRDIRPRDWGFDTTKIKAVTQKPKTRPVHRR